MKLSNFKLIRTVGSTALNKEFFAEVDVTTGHLFWKNIKRRGIRKTYVGYWHFIDTGEFTPLDYAENLARAWTAQTGEET